MKQCMEKNKQIKVLFWAAGENAKNIYSCLKENVSVEAFVENNSQRWGELFCDKKIISWEHMNEYDYEKIIITTPNYKQILKQLDSMGIPSCEIIVPFAPEETERNSWRSIFYVGELLYFVANQKLMQMTYQIDNLKYETVDEIKKENLQIPIIKTIGDTIQQLKQGYSMSRYGDGELNMILGRNFSTFQEPNDKLINRLKEILKSSIDNHMVCLPDIYGSFTNKNEEHKQWFRRHLYNGGRQADYSLFDMKKTYYNAFVTRPYKDSVDKSGALTVFNAFKDIWKNKDITIIEGSKTRFGVGNDLVANVKSCQRILCPSINAFDVYDEILQEAKEIDHKRMILIALGHTATVLAYDLAREGYQALDIGHLDIEYEWFLRGVDEKIPINNKYVNEAPLGRNVSEYIDDEKYNSEIIRMIKN